MTLAAAAAKSEL